MSNLASITARSTKAKVEKSRTAIHNALGRTETHRNQSVSRLEALIKGAEALRAQLQKQLPALAKAADGATGEARGPVHRAYLQAQQNIRHCDQVHNSAKRELIIARNF